MSLLFIKTGVALLVFAIGLLGASLPWILRARVPSERYLAWGDTFAGGVLGGAGLLHLLAGGIAEFRALSPGVGYPFPLFLAGAGFLLILLIEGVIVGEQAVTHAEHVPHRHPAASHELGAGSRPVDRRAPYAQILLLVLSIHSIIVGLALGAQRSLTALMVIFAAVIAHKGVAGFALGIGYTRTHTPWRKAAGGIAFFATMTPLGILAATGLTELIPAHGASVFRAVFDSVGAGTFLYIAALDIISAEFSSPEDRWPKWLSTCLGFGIMALLAIWI